MTGIRPGMSAINGKPRFFYDTFPVMAISNRNALFIIAAAAFAAYANSFHTPFVFDDNHTVVENIGIRNLADLKAVFTSDYAGRPLLFLTFALNYAAGGLNPFGYHLVNFLLHAATSFIVFLLLDNLLGREGITDRRWALAGALLFAVHPMNVEAVTYISSRSDGLATFFYCLAFLLVIAAGFRLNAKSLLALALFAAGLLTKEIAVTLPALLTVFVLQFETEKRKEAVPLLALFWLTLPLFFLYRLYALDAVLEKKAEQAATPYDYLLTQLTMVPLRYLPRLFVPINQNIDADIGMRTTLLDPSVMLGGGLIAAALIFAFVHFKRHRAYSFAVLWFLGTLSVTSSFYPIIDTYTERRLYIALPAFALAAAYALARLAAARPAALKGLTMAMGVVLAIFTVLAFQRNAVFSSPISLYEDAASKSGEKSRVYVGLAEAYMAAGMMDKAEETIRFAIKAFPDHVSVRLKHCWLLGNKGDFDGMRREIDAMRPERPGDLVWYYDFKGVLAGQAGAYAEGLSWLDKALAVDPAHVDARANRIILLGMMGRHGDALAMAREAVMRWPYKADYHYQLGTLLLPDDRAAAVREFEAALTADPGHRGAKAVLKQMAGAASP